MEDVLVIVKVSINGRVREDESAAKAFRRIAKFVEDQLSAKVIELTSPNSQ